MVALIALLISVATHADTMPTVFSCKEQKVATFDWEEGGMLSSPGITGKVDNKGGKEPVTVTLVLTGKKAMFKGNGGDAELEVLDRETFLERTSGGNIFMWKLLRGKDKVPPLLIQFKAYEIMGPYIHAWVFKCS